MTPITDRRVWIAMLAKLVAPGDSTAAAAALSAMLPVLDFPEAAFNIRSLEHVARTVRRLPSFADLADALGSWWRENRPTPPALTHEKAQESAWQAKHASERAEAKADWSDPSKVRTSRDLVLSSPIKQLDLGRMLAALVNRHAPQNVGLLPPEWLENLPVFPP